MKKLFLILVLALVFVINLNAQDGSLDSALSSRQFTSIEKLEYFAKGCNVEQVRLLLATDPDFNINYGAITLTPIQLATDAFIQANNKNEIWKCDDCINLIALIMKDSRYDFKIQYLREKTDLVYAILKEKELNGSIEAAERYGFLLNSMLNDLNAKTGFSINYSIGKEVLHTLPNTALQAASGYGKLSLCILLNRYPELTSTIDQRLNENRYTPLMFAARFNNLEAANILLSKGADYLKYFSGYAVQGIATIGIAIQSGHTPMVQLLSGYMQGEIQAKDCQ